MAYFQSPVPTACSQLFTMAADCVDSCSLLLLHPSTVCEVQIPPIGVSFRYQMFHFRLTVLLRSASIKTDYLWLVSLSIDCQMHVLLFFGHFRFMFQQMHDTIVAEAVQQYHIVPVAARCKPNLRSQTSWCPKPSGMVHGSCSLHSKLPKPLRSRALSAEFRL